MKLMNKDAVIAELEKLRKEWSFGSSAEAKYRCECYTEMLNFLNTIEVKEVDLEKELSYEDYESFFEKYPDLSDDWGFDETWTCAKYFFELGLKAKEGE